eukprot:1148615-Pelagomonas_calceolata.AAC.1
MLQASGTVLARRDLGVATVPTSVPVRAKQKDWPGQWEMGHAAGLRYPLGMERSGRSHSTYEHASGCEAKELA